MKVLFLLTSVGCRVKGHHPTGFLSAVLKSAGHETSFIELTQIDLSLLDAEIQSFKPDIIAASTVMQQFLNVKVCLDYVRKKYPHIKNVLGGTHPILKPDCIEEIQSLDALCISEGEMPLLNYVNSIQAGDGNTNIGSMYFRVDGQIIKNPNTYAVSEEDMIDLPLQDRLVFPRFRNASHTEPLGWNPRVLWSRGCPFACTYCSVPSIRKLMKEPLKTSKTRWVRYPPVEKAIEEIEMLRDRWNFDTFIIDDDVFTTRKDWVMEFANKYPSHLKDKVQFEANLRVESVDKEIMQALKDTGCRLLKFGLENGNYDIRRKTLKRPITDEKIKEVFKWSHEVGIPAHTFNIIGIPGETKETIWQTINLNRKIKPARVQVTIFFPYFGTPLGDETRKKGLVIKESDSYFKQASVELKDLDMKDLEWYGKWFKFLVYLPYDKKAAFQQLWGNTGKVLFQKIKSARRLGVLGSLQKIKSRLSVNNAPRQVKLPVETMGSDGETVEAIKADIHAQYDIEDMEANPVIKK